MSLEAVGNYDAGYDDYATLSFELHNLTIGDEIIEDDSCELIWFGADESTISNLNYVTTFKKYDGEGNLVDAMEELFCSCFPEECVFLTV